MDNVEILGIGTPFLDHILLVSEEYLASLGGIKGGIEIVDDKALKKIIVKSEAEDHKIAGGSGANVIKALASLSHKCALWGCIGDDEAGKFLLEVLKKFNIQSYLITTDLPTGQILCLVTLDGERTFRDLLGAAEQMHERLLTPEIFQSVQWVHVDGWTILNNNLTTNAMEMAKAAGAKVSFDLANKDLVKRFREKIVKYLSLHVDLLFSNEEEAYILTGMQPEKACMVMKDLADIAVVTMGKEGCWVGANDEVIYCPAFPVKAIDSTGAGDIFSAGFIHGILTDKSLQECAEYGAKLASAVVQVLGAEIPQETWEKLRGEILTGNSYGKKSASI